MKDCLFQPYSGCCGSTIMWCFSDNRIQRGPPLGPWLMSNLQDGHIYSAILQEQQVPVFQQILFDKGFRLVSDRTVNKNTKNRLYFYLRDPETPRPVTEPVKTRTFVNGAMI